jgi:hypothetical protein
MADWSIVRFDPDYPEKLDPEIIPLCDALNAAGFVTTASCCGHVRDWPIVWFEHSTDERTESLARFIIKEEQGDYRPHFSVFRKEILLEGYIWCLEIHCNNVYSDTPQNIVHKEYEQALVKVTQLIDEWREHNG